MDVVHGVLLLEVLLGVDLSHPGGMAGRKPGHEQSGCPRVYVNHAVAAWLGDTKRPVKEGLLAEKDPSVSAVALRLLPALQHHHRAGLHRRVLPQPLTQAPPVQDKQRQRHLQGFIAQPKRGSSIYNVGNKLM